MAKLTTPVGIYFVFWATEQNSFCAQEKKFGHVNVLCIYGNCARQKKSGRVNVICMYNNGCVGGKRGIGDACWAGRIF